MTNEYTSWEDFIEDDDQQVEVQPGSNVLQLKKDEFNLPPDIQALLEKKERLEKHLKKLTGQGEADPDEERLKIMYPVKVHTKETRIEQRKERKEQEKKHFQKLEALELRHARLRAEEEARSKRDETLIKLKVQKRIESKWQSKKELQKYNELVIAKKRQLLQEKMDLQLLQSRLAKKRLEKEHLIVQEQLDNRIEKLKNVKTEESLRKKKQQKDIPAFNKLSKRLRDKKDDQRKLYEKWENLRKKRLLCARQNKGATQKYFLERQESLRQQKVLANLKQKKEEQLREAKRDRKMFEMELTRKNTKRHGQI